MTVVQTRRALEAVGCRWVDYLGTCLQGINQILRKADGGFAEEFVTSPMARGRAAYLENTCCVLEGVAFEDPWPILIQMEG